MKSGDLQGAFLWDSCWILLTGAASFVTIKGTNVPADFGMIWEEIMKKQSVIILLVIALACGMFCACLQIPMQEVAETEDSSEMENLYPEGKEVFLPVLIYHHFIEEETSPSGTIVTEDSFREQMEALKAADYHSVTLEELIAFVECRGELPENPILITMDDGYSSNLTLAAPILEANGFSAAIFAIGSLVENGYGAASAFSHFSWDEASPWLDKGVVEVQSHTYNMHREIEDGYADRDGVLEKPGESEEEYRSALRVDYARAKAQLEYGTGREMVALAFPYGYYTDIAVEEAKKLGVKITFAADHGGNCVVSGDPESLHLLLRINVYDHYSGESLLRQIDAVKRSVPISEETMEK